MLNTSNEYKQYIADSVNSTLSRDFTARADIELADSTVLNVTEGDIVVKGLKISDATSPNNSFQIGSAIIGQCVLMLNNIGGKFDQYDFTDAVIRPRVGLRLSETTEWLRKGVFTVDEPTLASSVISLVALDNMNKFDTPFSEVAISFPCTALQLLQAVCLHCGVSLATVSFLNSNFVIERRPDDEAITCREIVSWIAQLSGNFARCNYNGALELKWYDYFPNVLDGNGNVDIVDGNGTADIIDGNAPVNYHHIYALGSSKIGTDDVVITGIQVKAMGTKEDYGETVLFGSPGYIIEITDNELITENTAATIANSVGAKIVGMQFRQFKGTALTDPSREAGDIAYLTDKKQNTYQILLSNINYEIGSLDKISSDAETPSRNSSVRYSAQTKAIVKARENVKKELTSYDIAVITLTESIVNGFGLYQTVVGDEIEGRIIYQHDKPTMDQSVKRWFRTSEGYIQQTRPNTSSAWVTTSGQDIYGNALYNTIITKGLSAEWIIAGIIASANNSSWFDLDNNSFSYANGALTYSPANGFRINTPKTKLIDGAFESTEAKFNGNLTIEPNVVGDNSSFKIVGTSLGDNRHVLINQSSIKMLEIAPTTNNATILQNTKVRISTLSNGSGGAVELGNAFTSTDRILIRAGNDYQTGMDMHGTGGNFVWITPDSNNQIQTSGDAYFGGNVSAQSFTDRTPFYNGDALSDIKKIADDGTGEIDHATLPDFARIKTRDGHDERDIGNMVSILTKAIQQLIEKDKEKDKMIFDLKQEVSELKKGA